MANKNQRKPNVRYDRLIGAVILFLLFLIVLTWIFGDKKEKPDQTANETSVSDETTEPPKTVYLSPSNQQDNTYAAGETNEAEAMRNLSLKIKSKLEQNGIIVYEAPEDCTLKEKVASANNLKVDAYVAIHSNDGSEDDKGSGTVCFYNPNLSGSKILSEYIYDAVSALTPTADRGIKDGTETSEYLYEVDKAKSAICFVEVESHTSEDYAKWILDNTDKLAESISSGIIQYLNSTNQPAESERTNSNGE